MTVVDANRQAINALGEQTAERFSRLQSTVDDGFAEMRGTLDQTAASQQQSAELLQTLIPPARRRVGAPGPSR